MPELYFCLRDWTKRTCKIDGKQNWCRVHRCPLQRVHIDDYEYDREYRRLMQRNVPEAHVAMHLLRSRVGEFLPELPEITYSIFSLTDKGERGEWRQSFTEFEKALVVANSQISQGILVVLVDDLNDEIILKPH